jgi:hypothetical protein
MSFWYTDGLFPADLSKRLEVLTVMAFSWTLETCGLLVEGTTIFRNVGDYLLTDTSHGRRLEIFTMSACPSD